MKSAPACFDKGSACFIQMNIFLNKAGARFKTDRYLFLNRWGPDIKTQFAMSNV